MSDTRILAILRGNIQLSKMFLTHYTHLSLKEKKEVLDWRNHDEIRKWMFSEKIIPLKEHLDFIEGLSTEKRNFYWIASEGTSDKIGVISLNSLDLVNRNAFLGIYKNPGITRTGAGVRLMKGLLELAFEKIGLHSLKLEVLQLNSTAISFYEKIGFRKEGVLKEFICKDNRWEDVVIMGIMNPIE